MCIRDSTHTHTHTLYIDATLYFHVRIMYCTHVSVIKQHIVCCISMTLIFVLVDHPGSSCLWCNPSPPVCGLWSCGRSSSHSLQLCYFQWGHLSLQNWKIYFSTVGCYRGLQVGWREFCSTVKSLRHRITELGYWLVVNYACMSDFQLRCSPSTNLQTSVLLLL